MTSVNYQQYLDLLSQNSIAKLNRIIEIIVYEFDGRNLQGFDHAINLETLNLYSCKNLKSLPELPATLKTLNPSYSEIKTLPDLSHTQLETLYLSYCENLESVPEMPSTLRELIVPRRIKNLPDLSNTQLETLNLSYCENLESVLEMPATLKELKLPKSN